MGDTLKRIARLNRLLLEEMMERISKQAARAKSVDSILASLRIEQLTPSAAVIKGMKACIAGEETTDNLIAAVIRQHVTLRQHR